MNDTRKQHEQHDSQNLLRGRFSCEILSGICPDINHTNYCSCDPRTTHDAFRYFLSNYTVIRVYLKRFAQYEPRHYKLFLRRIYKVVQI